MESVDLSWSPGLQLLGLRPWGGHLSQTQSTLCSLNNTHQGPEYTGKDTVTAQPLGAYVVTAVPRLLCEKTGGVRL